MTVSETTWRFKKNKNYGKNTLFFQKREIQFQRTPLYLLIFDLLIHWHSERVISKITKNGVTLFGNESDEPENINETEYYNMKIIN